MKLNELLRKLSSRKFWLALAGVATGIAVAFGVDESSIAVVAGAVTTVLSVAAYITAEGRVDAAGAAAAAKSIGAAVETVRRTEEEPHGTGADPS